jgi:hypothetical protein
MSEKSEYRKLKAKLRRDIPITDAKFETLWRELEKAEWVRWALDGDVEYPEFLGEARRRLSFAVQLSKADRRSGRRKVESRDDDYLSDADKDRASAVATYLALLADRDWDVKTLRTRIFEGRLLPNDEAQSLLQSQAARFLMREEFDQFRIPLLEHAAAIEVMPHPRRNQPEENSRLRIYLKVKGEYTYIDYRRVFSYESRLDNPLEIAIPDPGGAGCTWLPVWRDSVLDEVRRVSESLADRYSFGPHQATWYLLTGTPPELDPLDWAETHKAGFPVVGPGKFDTSKPTFTLPVLRLHLTPWVSEEAITKVFRVEPDRASTFLLHQHELEGKTAGEFRNSDESDRQHQDPQWAKGQGRSRQERVRARREDC